MLQLSCLCIINPAFITIESQRCIKCSGTFCAVHSVIIDGKRYCEKCGTGKRRFKIQKEQIEKIDEVVK